jgi:DNA repair photolyase
MFGRRVHDRLVSASFFPDLAKGRASTGNRTPTRFNLNAREADGDWLDERELLDGATPPLRTTVTVEKAKTIISTNVSPDIPFNHSINPYRGCEHGCIYCYARPSHAFHDLSPGLDFESKLFAKPEAAALLRKELGRKGYVPSPIALGTNTDPYQPIEKDWRITRSIIEVLADCDHALTITTKSDRVVRDIDILAPMAAKGLVAVAISVTSLDPQVHRTLEPRAPMPEKRLAAIRALTDAGIPAHINVSPIIPAITDHEMEAILEVGQKAGARTASYIPVRLPYEVAPLFRDWLDAHYPERAGKVMSLIQSIRQGRDNDPGFFTRMRGIGPWAELIRTRFLISCNRLGLNQQRIMLQQDQFRAPEGDQLRLF